MIVRSAQNCCTGTGPGYASPQDAIKAPHEKLLYLPCIVIGKQDYLATIDADPTSPTYSSVIHRVQVNSVDDELHHTGWNACSSCFGDSSKSRNYLIAPALKSGNVFVFDVSNQKAPKLAKVVSGEEIKEKTGLTFPHTIHCLASGQLMISMMGDKNGNAKGGFILLNGTTFDIEGTWCDQEIPFGYDFWYQPKHNIMVSTQWGSPNAFKDGFNPAHVQEKLYGNSIHFWNWKERTLIKTIELGPTGYIPLECRFLHDPTKSIGFVAAALSSTVFVFYRDDKGEWQAKQVIDVPAKEVTGWALPSMPGLITDILISMNDKFLIFSNWLHGDIRQYDISDPFSPKLVGQVFIGGSLREDGPVKMNDPSEKQPQIPKIKDSVLRGGPQMIQLSLDGRRLYVTNSLYSSWDKQFYPGLVEKGSQLLQIDVDPNGGLSINSNFLVDFEKEPYGPALAHEVRYPGGDCTSDIWI